MNPTTVSWNALWRLVQISSCDKKHLQPLKSFRGVRIVSPREFLNYLRSGLQPEA